MIIVSLNNKIFRYDDSTECGYAQEFVYVLL